MPDSINVQVRVHRDDRHAFVTSQKVGETETKGPSHCPTSALLAAAFFYCAFAS